MKVRRVILKYYSNRINYKIMIVLIINRINNKYKTMHIDGLLNQNNYFHFINKTITTHQLLKNYKILLIISNKVFLFKVSIIQYNNNNYKIKHTTIKTYLIIISKILINLEIILLKDQIRGNNNYIKDLLHLIIKIYNKMLSNNPNNIFHYHLLMEKQYRIN